MDNLAEIGGDHDEYYIKYIHVIHITWKKNTLKSLLLKKYQFFSE